MPKLDSNKPPTNYPFELMVAAGKISHHDFIHKFGFNPSVTTVQASIWDEGGPYTFPAAANTILVSSANIADTSNLVIVGLDANYNPLIETITLTGTSVVETSNSFLRVNRSYLDNGDVNVGKLTGNISGSIAFTVPATRGQTVAAVYTVPANVNGYLWSVHASSGSGKRCSV